MTLSVRLSGSPGHPGDGRAFGGDPIGPSQGASYASDLGTCFDQSGTGNVKRAGSAVGIDWAAPTATDVPGRKVQSARPLGIQSLGGSDHVADVVPLGEPGSEKDAPQVNVVGYIAAAELAQRLVGSLATISTAIAAFFWPMPGKISSRRRSSVAVGWSDHNRSVLPS
jgi:hypothetical protein